MEFTLVERNKPGGPVTWFGGIYKIVCWRQGQYRAYYLRDGKLNWGKFVSEPPCESDGVLYWPSFQAAKAACGKHAKGYSPAHGTQKQARSIASIRRLRKDKKKKELGAAT